MSDPPDNPTQPGSPDGKPTPGRAQLALHVHDRITDQIMNVDVQQFLANTISILKIMSANAADVADVPNLRHAFPFALSMHLMPPGMAVRMTGDALDSAIRDCADRTGFSEEALNNVINQRLDVFVDTQTAIQERRIAPQRVKCRDEIDEIMRAHPTYNSDFRPGSVDAIRSIIAAEGLRIVAIEEMPLLSACVSYREKATGQLCHCLFIRSGQHPLLEAFVLGHEFGHWWLHMKRGEAISESQDFYLHSAHDWGALEIEADIVSWIMLLPTPYLSWREVNGALDEQGIIGDVLLNLPPVAEDHRGVLDGFVKRRIEGYKAYRRFLQSNVQGLVLPNRAIPLSVLNGILEYLEANGFRWARLNEHDCVIDCGTAWAELFYSTPDVIRRRNLSIVDDFTTEGEQRTCVREQLILKRDTLKSTFYVTHYRHPDTGRTFPVTLNAFPVTDAGRCVGSIGIATPFPGLPSTSSGDGGFGAGDNPESNPPAGESTEAAAETRARQESESVLLSNWYLVVREVRDDVPSDVVEVREYLARTRGNAIDSMEQLGRAQDKLERRYPPSRYEIGQFLATSIDDLSDAGRLSFYNAAIVHDAKE